MQTKIYFSDRNIHNKWLVVSRFPNIAIFLFAGVTVPSDLEIFEADCSNKRDFHNWFLKLFVLEQGSQ